MKNKIFTTVLMAVLIGATSCKKTKVEDAMINPVIEFRTGVGYTYTNDSLPVNDTILVGIDAHKSEENDNLVRFIATKSYDGGPSTTFVDESMNNSTYSKDMVIVTRATPGVEKYTFTITNRDGLTGSKTLTFTVHP